jgi:hypothetical protein
VNVPQLRRLFLTNRRWAALFVALALAMKLLTPTGYMFVQEGGRIGVALCPGFTPMVTPPEMKMPGMQNMHVMPAAQHESDHGSPGEHAKPEMPCAFAGLSALALGAIDAVLLAAALAFVALLALRPVRPRPARRVLYLRPPLRGPPILL